jgi:uncharacterized membrane protein
VALLTHAFVATAPVAAENIITFDVPGATQGTFAFGVNTAGKIVGYYRDSSDVNHGFLRDTSGNITTIDYPGQGATGVAGISSSGVMVGNYSLINGAPIHGFLLSGGVFTNIDLPGSTQTTVNGISPSGRFIVGTFKDAAGLEHGYVLSGGVYKTIDFPGASYTFPSGVNNRGQIVGFDDAGGQTGFLLDKNGYKTLPFLGIATDINNKGEIVGYAYKDDEGFIYTQKSGVTGFKIDGRPTIPFGVSNNGEIVGYYFDDQGTAHGFAINPVPEPGAFSLMSIGVLSFLAYATMAARRKAIGKQK